MSEHVRIYIFTLLRKHIFMNLEIKRNYSFVVDSHLYCWSLSGWERWREGSRRWRGRCWWGSIWWTQISCESYWSIVNARRHSSRRIDIGRFPLLNNSSWCRSSIGCLGREIFILLNKINIETVSSSSYWYDGGFLETTRWRGEEQALLSLSDR